jgi:four helix bundle protein
MKGEHRTSNIERRTSKGEWRGKAWDLEERLLEFGARIIRLVESLPKSRAGSHLGGQLLRSGTSPLLNHGEAESAESPDDFVHKLRVCLKEFRETMRCLKLIQRVPLVKAPARLAPLLVENDELIRIFVASLKTAQANQVARR